VTASKLGLSMYTRAPPRSVGHHKSDQRGRRLLVRRPAKVAAVAMANKTARIIWAVLTKEHEFRPIAAPVAVLPAL
jgi:transposase